MLSAHYSPLFTITQSLDCDLIARLNIISTMILSRLSEVSVDEE